MKNPMIAVLTVVSILVGLLFLTSGAGKLANPIGAAKLFAHFGYAGWFATVIGVVEVLGGISLVIPRISHVGAGVLGAVMLGAAYSHLQAAEWNRVAFTVVLFATLVIIGMARWKNLQRKTGSAPAT